ncbi:MAG: guanylate kinase [Magnetococcales bacterium]|nr:guanylate kinase [Magnetococcales bacterium]
MSEKRRGFVLILSAPSGAGKSTLAQHLIRSMPDILISVSTTTRKPRPGEVEGQHYFFVEKTFFQNEIEQGNFLEWAEVFGNFYGTAKSFVEATLASGQDVVLDIDWQGARVVRDHLSSADVVGVSIVPPSLQSLRDRLERRGQDSAEVIDARMAQAGEEMSHWQEYEYLVINDDLEKSKADLVAIVRAERLTRDRMAGQVKKITDEFGVNGVV